eukprot:GSA120T00018907001.1
MAASASLSDAAPIEVRVLVVGEAGVGKSSLVSRLIHKSAGTQDITIGHQTNVWHFDVDSEFGRKRRIHMVLTDVGGGPSMRALQKELFKGATAVIFAFDLCDRGSFTRLSSWLREIHETCGRQNRMLIQVLVGNKVDLANSDSIVSHTPGRQVSESEARDYASAANMKYVETSAYSGANVEPFFREIGREIAQLVSTGEISLDTPDIHGVRLAKIPMAGGAMRPYGQGAPPLAYGICFSTVSAAVMSDRSNGVCVNYSLSSTTQKLCTLTQKSLNCLPTKSFFRPLIIDEWQNRPWPRIFREVVHFLNTIPLVGVCVKEKIYERGLQANRDNDKKPNEQAS